MTLMYNNIYNKLILLFSFIFIFGCSNKDNYNIEIIDLASYSSLSIDANNILIENKVENSIEYPFIDHLISNNMKFYIDEWIKTRIAPNYESENLIKIIINKANIKAFSLNNNNNIQDIFINKAAKRVEIDVYLIIEIIDAKNKKLAYLDLKAFKSKELDENISLKKKDYIIQNMINETLMDFDKLAIAKMKEIFSAYVRI